MCGIIGAYSLSGSSVVEDIFWGLKDLEHRGQEGCGLACPVLGEIIVKRSFGSVDNLHSQTEGLISPIAIGHTRYSTTGSSSVFENLQPIVPQHHRSALAHNGNLVNSLALKEMLELEYPQLFGYGSSDSGLIAAYLHHEGEGIQDRIRTALKYNHFLGAFSIVIATRTKLIAVRDPWGIRPLSLARTSDKFFVASETCAFRESGAQIIDDVSPGEMITFQDGRFFKEQLVEPQKLSFCIFEAIYFARPDSYFDRFQVESLRYRLGQEAASEFLKEHSRSSIDVIAAVPDSGTAAALGFAKALDLGDLFGRIFLKVRGQRTFISPDSTLRRRGVTEKLAPIVENIRGKRIALVDDSIVRGNTSRAIVSILQEAGASAVHLVIPSPRIIAPCYYGIDMVTKDELIANNMSIEEETRFLGVNSLTHIGLQGMKRAIPFSLSCCDACFSNCYPIEIDTQLQAKSCLE